MIGIRQIAQWEEIFSLRELQSRHRASSVRELIAAYYDKPLKGGVCGVPNQSDGLSPQTFGSPGGRWTRGSLKVLINTKNANFMNAPSAPPTTAEAVIMNAFGLWQAISRFFNFTFLPREADPAAADIRVIFGGTQVHPKFGSQGGVFGSAGFPENGNIQFDSAEVWSPNFLLSAALHEIGHSLGLDHSNAPASTMYPNAPGTQNIDAESEMAIQALYGWQPQQRAGGGTSHRASLGVTTSAFSFTHGATRTLHMAWRGIGNDSMIYFSEYREEGWTQQQASGMGSSHSPALTESSVDNSGRTHLLMAWRGIGNDSGIYWSQKGDRSWENMRAGSGGSSAAPALANVNGQIYMAWKGIGNDSGIYWATYNGQAKSWSPQAKVRYGGTSDSPALVAFNGLLYMFWKGIGNDVAVYYSFFDVANNDLIWRPQRRIEYFSYETDGGAPHAIATSGALSAAVRGNSIILTWKGIGDDSTIWFSFFRDNEFSGQAPVPNVGTSVGPSVVQVNGRTYVAWRGIGGDNGIYWARL